MIRKDLNVLYLSVTGDILRDEQHFRRIFLRGLGRRVGSISYLVHTREAATAPIKIADNVTLVPVKARTKLGYIRRAVSMAEVLYRQASFDVTVCMTPLAAAAAGYWVRCRTGTPFLVHWSHDFLGDWGWRLEAPTHMLYWPVIRWLSRRADSMRPIAERLAASILKGGVLRSRVTLLPTLLNSDLFVPADHPNSGANPFRDRPADEKHILFVGRLAKQKNIPLLLRAAKKLLTQQRSVHVWIIGDGELWDSVKGLIHGMQLDAHVTMLGRKSLSDLQPYYAHCDVFVLPSNHEGLARVLAEASLCAAPIVCTQVGGVEDNVLSETTALLTPRNDLAALVSAIGTLLDDPTKARHLARSAREYALKHYPPIEEQYDRWVEYWIQVASSACHPARPNVHAS